MDLYPPRYKRKPLILKLNKKRQRENLELNRIFKFFCMFCYNSIIWCVKSLHSKSSCNMMIKIKLRPFLLCRTVISKGFVQHKEQWGMFLPWKIRDLLTPMKIWHFNDSQGDLLMGGQATPPQRWECEKRGNFCGSFAIFHENLPLWTQTDKKPEKEGYKQWLWQLVLHEFNKITLSWASWGTGTGCNFNKCVLFLLPNWNPGSHWLQLDSLELVTPAPELLGNK